MTNTTSTETIDTDFVAHTRPPAKLNLFLELLALRDDGFHEIDTVMVPIDWCDELKLRRRTEPGIKLSVDWIPSRSKIAAEFGVDPDSETADRLLAIPNDQSNLVHRALTRFSEEFSIAGGFDCELGKSIPAGAGMGGASSDAASALLCAAALCGVDPYSDAVNQIAAEIGSDVPFFLGQCDTQGQSITAGRATGRGEVIEAVSMRSPIDFLVVFPPITLVTSLVYASSLVPREPKSGDEIAAALEKGDLRSLHSFLLNRLTDPAKKIAPQITEILESMWRNGLTTCQLTGSGSACFAIASSSKEATTILQKMRTEMSGPPTRAKQLGIRARAAQSVSVPAEVRLIAHR